MGTGIVNRIERSVDIEERDASRSDVHCFALPGSDLACSGNLDELGHSRTPFSAHHTPVTSSGRDEVGGSSLADAEGLGSLPQIRRLYPKHPAAATGTRAEDLHRRNVDVRLGKFLHHLGNGARPVFALDEKPAFLGAQLEPCGPGRPRERGAVCRDEVQLGSACAMRECRDTDQVDARTVQGGQDAHSRQAYPARSCNSSRFV